MKKLDVVPTEIRMHFTRLYLPCKKWKACLNKAEETFGELKILYLTEDANEEKKGEKVQRKKRKKKGKEVLRINWLALKEYVSHRTNSGQYLNKPFFDFMIEMKILTHDCQESCIIKVMTTRTCYVNFSNGSPLYFAREEYAQAYGNAACGPNRFEVLPANGRK